MVNIETDNRQKSLLLAVLAVLAGAFVLWFVLNSLQTADPYANAVLAMEGSPTRGNQIFQMNCTGCHGWREDGRVGPSLEGVSDRKSKLGIIHQVTSGATPPMPQFQPSPQEMADLLSYLETL